MKRSQVAIEFLLIAMFATFFLTGMLTTIRASQQNVQEQANNEQLLQIADRLQQELVLASTMKQGFTRTITLQDVDGYSLTHTNNSFTVSNAYITDTRLTPEFSGNMSFPTVTFASTTSGVVVS